jgi:CheY-like chemotaxis protein
MNQRLMQQILARRDDLLLQGAVTAEQGIEMVRAQPPAVILMDINLPGMNGFEALAALKGDPATAHIPVLAVSANAMKGDEERGLAAGFDAYLTKPLAISALFATLDRVLEKAAANAPTQE